MSETETTVISNGQVLNPIQRFYYFWNNLPSEVKAFVYRIASGLLTTLQLLLLGSDSETIKASLITLALDIVNNLLVFFGNKKAETRTLDSI